MIWLPEMARRRPARTITISVQPRGVAPPHDPDTVLVAALQTAGLTGSKTTDDGWELSLPDRTRVYGVIPREVDETISLRIISSHEFPELVISCHPTETHDAHAVGLAGIFVAAAAVWFAGGLMAGMLPAATALLAGALLVDVTRHWAFDALERRLRRLAGDVGSALWPGQSAQITVT